MASNLKVVVPTGQGTVYLRCQDCRQLVGIPGRLLDRGRLPVDVMVVDLNPMVEHALADLPNHPSIHT